MNEKPITLDVLKDIAENGLVNEIQARELPNGSGYHLIARTRKMTRVLHLSRHRALPRLFKSLDAIADNCREMGIKRFEVVGLSNL